MLVTDASTPPPTVPEWVLAILPGLGLAVAIAAVASSGKLDWREVGRRIVTFPPFIAIVVALVINDLDRPLWLTALLDALAGTLTPIALAAVGCALRFDRLKGHAAPIPR